MHPGPVTRSRGHGQLFAPRSWRLQPRASPRDGPRVIGTSVAKRSQWEGDRRHRLIVLWICCISLFMVGVDTTIVNIALPSLGRSLGASVTDLQWVVDSYVVVVASLLLLSGSMADRFGRRRVFQLGLAVFGLGSLLASLAPSLEWLVASRILQAVGGSMLNPVAISIIRNTFTDYGERARAIGTWGAVYGISLAMGLPLGGVLVASVGWRSIFWINVPIAVAAIVLTARCIPESKAPNPRRLDVGGQAMVVLGLGATTFAMIEGPEIGWYSTPIVISIAAAAVSLGLLLWHEPRRLDPLLELRFFRNISFSGAAAIAVLSFAGDGAFLFLNTLYLQDGRGYSAVDTGLLMLPLALVTLLLSPISGRLIGNYGNRTPLLLAGGGFTLGALMLTRLSATTSLLWLVVSYLVLAVGMGMVNPPITSTAVTGMPSAQAGLAAAIASASRQVGASLGVAIVGIAVPALVGRQGVSSAVLSAHAGWWTVVGCGAAVLLVAFLSTTRWARLKTGTVDFAARPESPHVASGG